MKSRKINRRMISTGLANSNFYSVDVRLDRFVNIPDLSYFIRYNLEIQFDL